MFLLIERSLSIEEKTTLKSNLWKRKMNKYISDYDIYQRNEITLIYLGRFPTRLRD